MEKEHTLEDTDFLVSQTDVHGNIIFANEDLCKISGYALNELIGKPHNILRHPDMPKTIFKELWETVKNEGVWKGHVKNRTKNGDYYWVFATVYPNSGCTDSAKGYISCRRKATRSEIQTAINHYSQL